MECFKFGYYFKEVLSGFLTEGGEVSSGSFELWSKGVFILFSFLGLHLLLAQFSFEFTKLVAKELIKMLFFCMTNNFITILSESHNHFLFIILIHHDNITKISQYFIQFRSDLLAKDIRSLSEFFLDFLLISFDIFLKLLFLHKTEILMMILFFK
jgi:hypothetical protein